MKKYQLSKKFISIYIVSVFILGGLFGSVLFDGILVKCPVEGASIVVDSLGGGDYQTIQDAIDNATSGDTIYVWDGIYNESIVLNKSLTLIGNGTSNTTINGISSGTVINITANWVNVSGFTVSKSGSLAHDSGIKLYNVQFCKINNTYCTNNENGIILYSSSNNSLENNECKSNQVNGINLLSSQRSKLRNNTCTNNDYGIHLKTSNDTLIENNICNSNAYIGIFLYLKSNSNHIMNNICNFHTLYSGIRLSNSNKNYIFNNTCEKNSDAIYFSKSSSNIVEENELTYNYGNAIYLRQGHRNQIADNNCDRNDYGGIYLADSNENVIINNSCNYNDFEGIRIANSDKNKILNNNFSKQTGGFTCHGIRITTTSNENIIDNNSILNNYNHGIGIESGNNNHIMNNTISSTIGDGIELLSTTKGNRFYHNNIIDNNIQVDDAGTNIWNLTYPGGGNYWNDYSGYDNNSGPNQNLTGKDGFGDTPYNVAGSGGNADKYPLMHPNFWWTGDCPIIFLYKPNNNTLIKAGTLIQFDIWDPNFNLNNTFFSVNGGPNQSFTKEYEIDTSSWSCGNYKIKVWANDTENNSIVKYFNFSVDALDPVIDLINPTDGSAILPGTILNFNVSDINLWRVISYIDGAKGESFFSPYDINTSGWSEGQHSILIRAEDLVNHVVFKAFKFSIDTTPPIISLIVPSNNSIIKVGMKIQLNILEPNIANSNYSINGTVNQTFSDPFNISTTGWSDGDYKIYVHVEDTLKHKAMEWFNFTVDATLPEIILNSPDNNSVIIPGQILDFIITDYHLAEVYYSINNGLNITFTLPYEINTTGYSDGNYELRIVAKDSAENYNVKLYRFYVDSTKPIIRLISPKNNSVFNPGININFNIIDINLKNIYYSINGGNRVSLPFPYTISTSGWSDGQYNIEIYANDTLDHQNVKTYKFIIDTISPSIILNSPVHLSFIYPGTLIDIQINEINLDHVNYSINNGINQTFTFPYNIDSFTWPDGDNSVHIYAIDKAGNSATKKYKFTIDSTKPSIELLSPTNNSIITQGTQIRFDIIELNIEEVSYSLNNDSFRSFDYFYTILTSNWQDGNHKVRIFVKDKANNIAIKSFNFNIDSSPPNILLISPSNNSITSQAQIMDFKIEEPHIASVFYSINGNPVQTFYYPYNLSTKGWLDGKYSIKIKAIDLVNYQNIKIFTITLDSTEPNIICESPENNSIIRMGQLLDFTITDQNLDIVSYSINNGQNIDLSYPYNINTNSWLDGIYLLKITAVDKAGNSLSYKYKFILDSTEPIIKLMAPANNTNINLGIIIDLEIVEINLLKAEYSIDDNEFFRFERPYNLSTKNWSLGAHILSVKATDIAGHIAINMFYFTIEKTAIPPRIVFVLPLNGSTEVPIFTNVVIEFSKEMNKYTVDYSITILPTTKGVEFKWNNNSYLTIIFPSKLLEKTNYMILINKSAEDRSGVHLEKDYLLFFTTWADNDQDGKQDSDDDDDDNDHIIDVWELEYGLDPRDNSDASRDLDNDNLTNLEEHLLGTLPNIIDSDKDGLNDGLEVKIYYTNPMEIDSDNDGVSDGIEITLGSDPNDPEEVPKTEVEKPEEQASDQNLSGIFIGAIIIITIFCIIFIVLIALIIKRSRKKVAKNNEIAKIKQSVDTNMDSDVKYVVPDFTIEEIDEEEVVDDKSSFEMDKDDRR
jgi:parallel beta-helix repeat protein